MKLTFAGLAAVAVAAIGCGQPDARPPRGGATDAGTSAATEIVVGSPAPPFSRPTIDGTSKVTVPSGKVTVLVFWATWSHPDMQELVRLQELYVQYAPKGLAIIAISVDDESQRLPDFAATYGLKFPIAWDEAHRIAERYLPRNDPSTYILDGRGVVHLRIDGWHDGDIGVVEAEVAKLLAAPR